VLIATDLGLAVLIGSIPLAATLGLLRMEWLYVVGFLSTSLTFTAGLAAIAFLPALVGRERLVELPTRRTRVGRPGLHRHRQAVDRGPPGLEGRGGASSTSSARSVGAAWRHGGLADDLV
jgi:hypothetical protein